MSLKRNPKFYPELQDKELLAALEDYKNGKKSAIKKLRKFVNHTISEQYYDLLIAEYRLVHNSNRIRNERKRAKKIKSVFCGIVACIVLFGSMLITVGEILVRDGKGVALVYVVLFLWAVTYATSSKQDK